MNFPNPREQVLLEAERDLLLEKIGVLDVEIATSQIVAEGAWTGSHGGHDPDYMKLRGGLMKFWNEKARSHPHPFTYCVRHLSKHVANPERLCAWLKDQALGRTDWRKGRKKSIAESDPHWEPSMDELREALMAYEEAAEELGLTNKTSGGSNGAGASANEGRQDDDTPPAGGEPAGEGSEAGASGAAGGADPSDAGASGEAKD